MNKIATGEFIAKKRKERNLTQEQLAERLGVSNKTVSKWETGTCMPDYSIVELLCVELNTTLSELINGAEAEKGTSAYDNQQIVEMIRETRELKNTKLLIAGFVLIIMGGVMIVLSRMFGGTNIQDFISGVMLGISVPEMLTGVFLLGRSLAHRNYNRNRSRDN